MSFAAETPTSVRARRAGGKVLAYSFLAVSCLVLVFPFVWMLSSSLKPITEIFAGDTFLPSSPTLDGYVSLFQRGAPRALWNSFFIAAAFTVLSVFLCALAGYAFAKFRFAGRTFLFAFVLATLTIPLAAILVPLFVMMRNTFGWINTPWPLIVPWAANAFGIFFMRQYMQSISDELLDAARVDGAGEFTIFMRIVLPIARPGLASLAIIFFMARWNDFLWPLAVLRDPQTHTFPLLINALQGPPGLTAYDVLMAAGVVSILPLVVVFLLLQRHLMAGIAMGAVRE